MKKILAATLALMLPLFMICRPVLASAESGASSVSPESSLPQATSSSLEGKYEGYNIVLVVLEALRPDFLSCYGYSKGTSPNITALAEQGVVFENAFSQANTAMPSVATIYTSLYPQSHNVRMTSEGQVSEQIATLAQILSSEGYDTAWFGVPEDPRSAGTDGMLRGFDEKHNILKEQIGPWVGEHKYKPFFLTIYSRFTDEMNFPFSEFDNVFSEKSLEVQKNLDDMNKKTWETLQEKLRSNPNELDGFLGEDWVGFLGKDWVEEHRKELFVPYTKGVVKKLTDKTALGKERSKWRLVFKEIYLSLYPEATPDQRAALLALLDDAVFEADQRYIGSLVEQLKEAGTFDKTLIVVTADCGNEYFEHGRIGHGAALYDESIRVPLIMYVPGLSAPLRKKELVESVDILPTVLGLLKIQIPPQAQGVSLVNLMQNEAVAPSREFIFSMSRDGAQCIRSGDWKYIQGVDSSSGNELYDLKADPLEKKNVISENEKVAEDLEKKLSDWKAGLPVYT